MPIKKNQKHDFPAFASMIFPGDGQLAKGHIAKGILTKLINWTLLSSPFIYFHYSDASFTAFTSSLLSGSIDANSILFFCWLITIFIFRTWNMYDAYNSN
ncbi:MAG: hypothetical protein AAF380_02125 [Bacteroidota bacterium]